MQNEKKISVILPVYNGEDHVAEAIESVLQQTYSNLELIIVNDCSTDSTSQILESYAQKDSRVRVVTNPVNFKLPKTLNEGFRNATGEYYTWTSDDNRYRPNALERLVNALQADKDAVMVYSDFTLIDGSDNVIEAYKKDDPDKLPFFNSVGASFLYTREVAQKVGGYDENLFLTEDYDYWIRIWREGKIIHIKEDLYLYRLHDKSLTSTRKDAIQKQVYKTLGKHFLFLYGRMKTKREKKKFLDNLLDFGSSLDQKTVLTELASVYPFYRVHVLLMKVKKVIMENIDKVKDVLQKIRK